MSKARIASFIGYFGLLGLWIAWSTVFAPTRHAPTALILVVTALPLLIPLRGMLYDRRGSFIILGLLSLVYFMHGVGAATDPRQLTQAGLEIVFSLCLFGGSLVRLRVKDRPQEPVTHE
jgi:uncharacterized membrane protein